MTLETGPQVRIAKVPFSTITNGFTEMKRSVVLEEKQLYKAERVARNYTRTYFYGAMETLIPLKKHRRTSSHKFVEFCNDSIDREHQIT